MRIPALIALASIPASAQLRGTTNILKDPGRIGIEYSLRADPPASALDTKFIVLHPRSRTVPDGPAFFSRVLLDKVNHSYFGYELFLERQRPGTYLATFGKLGVTPLDLAGSMSRISLDWTLQPQPELPKPRVVHDDDVLSVELFLGPFGAKLIDDIKVTPPPRITGFVPVPIARPAPHPAPTVTGPPRDFTASDAELQITTPRGVTLNGVRQASIPLRNVHGSLIWLYIPDQGRYVMSLTPRPDLNFKPAGEVRGGLISFTADGASITLECPNPIAPGDAPYHLYVLHDEDWEPISEAQKTRPSLGSVSPAELTP